MAIFYNFITRCIAPILTDSIRNKCFWWLKHITGRLALSPWQILLTKKFNFLMYIPSFFSERVCKD